jgi:hypothetical protein
MKVLQLSAALLSMLMLLAPRASRRGGESGSRSERGCVCMLGRLARANKRKEGRNGLHLIGKVQLSLHRTALAGAHADSIDVVCRTCTL